MKTRTDNRIADSGTFERKRTLRVCVLYEEITDWERAWLMLDHLHTSTNVRFSVDWYSFAELPMLFDRACGQAMDADVILIANTRQRHVPTIVSRWLKQVRSAPSSKSAALVGLFSDEKSQDGICHWDLLLEDLAIATGRDLFIRTEARAADRAEPNMFDGAN